METTYNKKCFIFSIKQARFFITMSKVIYTIYDGNGNVSELITISGAIAGHYEYDLFGGTIALTGSLAKENSFRFSTKYADEETGFYYYGYRFYQPTSGRWLSRDSIDEDYLRLQEWFLQAGFPPSMSGVKSPVNLYHFVYNHPLILVDPLGKQPQQGGQQPQEGQSCCEEPCDLGATFERMDISPTLTGGGCTRQRATGWNISVKVNYTINSGVCHILGCKYWTCNTGRPRSDFSVWTSGGCGGWTYSMVGDPDRFPNDGYHAKAMAGKIEYLSCENSVWTKKELDAGSLAHGLYYDPPEVWSGGQKIYPTDGSCP